MNEELNEEQAKNAARSKVRELGAGYFPEDDWYSLSPNWDLNLWMDESGGRQATIYPVKNGNTDTRNIITVDLQGLFSRSLA